MRLASAKIDLSNPDKLPPSQSTAFQSHVGAVVIGPCLAPERVVERSEMPL